MVLYRSRVVCFSFFRWPRKFRSRPQAVKVAPKGSGRRESVLEDLDKRSVDSEPYTPTALEMEPCTPTALDLGTLRRMIGEDSGDEDSSGSTPFSVQDQEGAADDYSKDFTRVGYVTGQLRSVLNGSVNPTVPKSGNSGYSAVAGLPYSSNSNSGGDLSSVSSSKSLTSDSEVDSLNTQFTAPTDASRKFAVVSFGSVHRPRDGAYSPELEYETPENSTAVVAVAGGGSEPNWRSQQKSSVQEEDEEDENQGWYVHVSKTAQCIVNHYQLRPIMDELRYWSMQVPGTTNVRYRHNTGVEVALPWPDLRTGSKEQIQQFVSTVNQAEGWQVFYYLLKEHPKGFILSRPPPSPTSFRSSGSVGRANHREWRETRSSLGSKIDGHLLLPPPLPAHALTAPPSPTSVTSGYRTSFEYTRATDRRGKASGSRLITGFDSNINVLGSYNTVPQNSHGGPGYPLYIA